MEIALLVGQLLLKYGPSVAKEFQILFTKGTPTQDDWDKIWALTEKPFESYMPPGFVMPTEPTSK